MDTTGEPRPRAFRKRRQHQAGGRARVRREHGPRRGGASLSYDSHCHLDFDAFDHQRDAVLARAVAAGVEAVLVPGVDRAQWERASRLPRDVGRFGVRFAIGVHPQGERADLDGLEEWIDRLDACAVGELGWDKRLGELDRQTELAEAQLDVARARGLPVILHVVGAHGLALERLERRGTMRGVVHGYSGAAELVPRYLALGLDIAFGPSVTRSSARKVREAARRVPVERLLVETDGPDQRVERGSRGEPADVGRVIEALAEVRGERVELIDAVTTDNARRLFG